MAEIEIGVFLNQGHGPEHQELLRLIGTLVDEAPPGKEAGKAPSKRNLPPAPSRRGPTRQFDPPLGRQ